MEMAAEYLPGVEVLMLSLHTAVHAECNLDRGPSWGILLHLLEEGKFAGSATGALGLFRWRLHVKGAPKGTGGLTEGHYMGPTCEQVLHSHVAQ